jgi:hypothetical protein
MLFEVPPASWMKKESAGHLGDPAGLGVFAAQADRQHGADVGMTRQRKHEADGVFIIITTRKTDDMGIGLVPCDGMGHETRAFDRVDHQHEIADALASVGAQPALPCVVRSGHHFS